MTETGGTPQEAFWAGEFGDEYTRRNQGDDVVAANTALFARALAATGGIENILELGANRGLNLRSLSHLLPNARQEAVEINAEAAACLREEHPEAVVHTASLLDFEPAAASDLVLLKGVLIHLAPEVLEQAYARIRRVARRYVLMAEYYNPSPVEIPYRGHEGKLFKRDFAGEFLDQAPDFRLRDYGFVYRRDPNFPQDDITWFLLERTEGESLC